jgi:phage virion morphogenesis protein
MTGVKMTLTEPGLADVEKRLADLVAVMPRPRKLMNNIGAVLEASTKKRFRTNIAPDGTSWKPSIRARLKGGRTLFQHGHLRDSITHDAEDQRVEIGSNLIYAAIHQLGGVIRAKAGGVLTFNIPGIGWRRVASVAIPARPYLGVSEDDRLEILDQGDRFVRQMLA